MATGKERVARTTFVEMSIANCWSNYIPWDLGRFAQSDQRVCNALSSRVCDVDRMSCWRRDGWRFRWNDVSSDFCGNCRSKEEKKELGLHWQWNSRKRCIKTVGREIYHHLSSIIQALNTYIFFWFSKIAMDGKKSFHQIWVQYSSFCPSQRIKYQ